VQDLVYLEFTQKFPSTINGLSRVSRYSVQFVAFHLFEFDFFPFVEEEFSVVKCRLYRISNFPRIC